MEKIRKKRQRTPFGIFMEELRKQNNESITDMSEKLCISRSYLTQIELGIKYVNVPLYFIEKVCKVYHMTPTESKKFKSSILKSNKDMKVMDFSKVSKKNKQKILNFVCDLMCGDM